MSKHRKPDDIRPGDAVYVHPKHTDPISGVVPQRRDALDGDHIYVVPDDPTYITGYWPRNQVVRRPSEEQPSETHETVEVPVHLLQDILKGGFSIQGNGRDRVGRALDELIKLIPDPEKQLVNRVRALTGNPELSEGTAKKIIAAVREQS